MLKYPHAGSPDCPENLIYDDFDRRIDRFVKDTISHYTPPAYRQNKVIHDCVWGTVMFYPWELQIIDSPLIQRLRRIKQLGLAVITYPSAHNTRFEHTLGVMSIVTKMSDGINRDSMTPGISSNPPICPDDIYKLRMAALLHDAGHCFLSHQSEQIYSSMPEFDELKSSFNIFEAAQAHEIFSYIIINTKTFVSFFHGYVDYPKKSGDINDTAIFLNNLGRMIVGADTDIIEETNTGRIICQHYLTQMINGTFDADMLDYLRRDSYATGLALSYHIDRFLYKIRLVEHEEVCDGITVTGQHLTIPPSGITTIEEMAFSKLMLTRYIYQHHKVLATSTLLIDLVRSLRVYGKLIHPCDFLYLCDDDIDNLSTIGRDSDFMLGISKNKISHDSQKTISDLANQLLGRQLPKRAFVVNFKSVKSLHEVPKEDLNVMDVYDALKNIDSLRDRIYSEACIINSTLPKDKGGKKVLEKWDIHYNIPKINTTKNYSKVFVHAGGDRLIPMPDAVDLHNWTGMFSGNSWNAYVFANSEVIAIVAAAAKVVFESLGFEFVEELMFMQLKDSAEISAILTALEDSE